jgi:hypothetical protein
MGKILKYWPEDEIILALQKLPKDKPINFNTINEYHKQGLICDYSTIGNKFGSFRKACLVAGIRCDCKVLKYTKENLIQLLQQYNQYPNLSPTNITLMINKEKNCDIRGAIKKHFGTFKAAFDAANIPYKNHYWSHNRVIKALQQLYIESNKDIVKSDINKYFSTQRKICKANMIRIKFGSLDKAAEYASIEFKDITKRGRGLGAREKEILDTIEKEKGIIIQRQFYVAGSFIDGYDKINNVAYEIDEPHHKLNLIPDFIREEKVREVLGCNFVRIQDGW